MDKEKKLRGLAALSPERRKEIARLGALAIHKKGLAYQWDAKTAAIASLKGWGKTMKFVVEFEEEDKKEASE